MVPVPESLAPDWMVTPLARVPVTASSPALTVKAPVCVEVEETNILPAPDFVMAAVLVIGPLITRS